MFFKSTLFEIWLCHLANCIPVGHSLYTQFNQTLPLLWNWLSLACETRTDITSKGVKIVCWVGHSHMCLHSFYLMIYMTSPHLMRSPIQVLAYLHTIKHSSTGAIGNEATFRGIMDQYVNFIRSNCQALI